MLSRVRLLVLDLDYLIFDSSELRLRALRQSLIGFADSLPFSSRLPNAQDVESGYVHHGFRWTQFLEIGLGEESLSELGQAYRINEGRLLESGAGHLYPGLEGVLLSFRRNDVDLALGADASRDYLVTVSDRHRLDRLFQTALCTEEFGAGGAREMFEEIMIRHEVHPSETLVLGTRPAYFESAGGLDLLTIGCAWGLSNREVLAGAHYKAVTPSDLRSAVAAADAISLR